MGWLGSSAHDPGLAGIRVPERADGGLLNFGEQRMRDQGDRVDFQVDLCFYDQKDGCA